MGNTNNDILKVVKAQRRIEEIQMYGKSIWGRSHVKKSKKIYNRKRDLQVSFDFLV